MTSICLIVAVASPSIFIIRVTVALPTSSSTESDVQSRLLDLCLPFLVGLGLERYSLSSHSLALDRSLAANVTGSNSIFVAECGEETPNVVHAHNFARAAAMVAKADAVCGAQSPFGFGAMFESDSSKHLVSKYDILFLRAEAFEAGYAASESPSSRVRADKQYGCV